MKIRNVETGKTADVSDVLGRHLISTRNFVAAGAGDDEPCDEVPSRPKRKARTYKRRDMRPER